MHAHHARAVVLEQPHQLGLRDLALTDPGDGDIVVDIEWSGISTGTERLLWDGRMPPFPGMGYPLVPGYEAVGRVLEAGRGSGRHEGERVFVPGARCFQGAHGLFGAAASRLVVPAARAVPISDDLGEDGVLLALAATAYHTVSGGGKLNPVHPPDLIVGHGVLGRLLARMTVLAEYPAPTVWETCPQRREGAEDYPVVHPDDDPRRDYRSVYEVSGDAGILDRLISHLAPGGEVVLAGFYDRPLSFDYAPAFMREARIRTAAEWKAADMRAVCELAESGFLPLHGLITHHAPAGDAADAYRTAFTDKGCLKMVLDWRHPS